MLIRLLLTAFACWAAMWGSAALASDEPRILNWAEKMFSQLSHDFGTVARGADVRHHIVVTNLYEENVIIEKVDTTCGCTAASPNKTLLTTGEKALIEVQMDTKKFMRRKDSNVDVTLQFQGPQGTSTKTVRVPITAYIRSDVVVTPGNVDFGSIELGQPQERRLNVAYAGRSDWKIQEIQVPNSHLHVEATELARDSGKVEYELIVRLDDRMKAGSLQDQITLITDDANAPEVPVLVFAKLEPDITITPETFPLGKLKPGEQKSFNIVIKGKKPFVISKIECESTRDCFEVMQLSDQPKPVHIIPFRMTVPDKPGQFREEFTFTIHGRSEPVTCRAEGTIGTGS